MKTLKEYITESFSNKKYQFKVKIAGEVNEDQITKVKTVLEKWGVDNFTKHSTTPIQSLPLDFPTLKNSSVTIFDVTLNYPTTPQELHEVLSSACNINKGSLVVRNPGEPSEEYQAMSEEKKKEALLLDPNYSELDKINTEDFYGDKYNENLLKDLAKVSKERAKAHEVKADKGK
jgi:hypothetical protein